ncbi:response regulator transcription factor [Shimia sp.]|uniref:response regulator transcription factor n=1 Tax=Shimia sp. TaxID=1954381 RepID=UPI003B8C0719
MSCIIVIDPDRSALERLQTVLEVEGHEVRAHVDPDTAMPDVGRHAPDLVIMETRYNKTDGLALFERLRDGFGVPVILISRGGTASDEAMFLRLGAADFLSKPYASNVMSARVAAALRAGQPAHQPVSDSSVLERGPLRLDRLRHEATWDGEEVILTATEFNVLWIIAQRPGHVLSRASILDLAYGEDVYVTDRSIDSQVKRIRRKLRGVAPEFSAIQTLYGLGYRFTDTSPRMAA